MLHVAHNDSKTETLVFNGRDAERGEFQTFRVPPGGKSDPVYLEPGDAAFAQHDGARVVEHKGSAKPPTETAKN